MRCTDSLAEAGSSRGCEMGAILTPALKALRDHKVPGYVPAHGTDSGECVVMLGPVAILARYEATWAGTAHEHIEVTALCISGEEVGTEWFDAGTLALWADEIKADRASDLRIAREAAEFERWEAFQ